MTNTTLQIIAAAILAGVAVACLSLPSATTCDHKGSMPWSRCENPQ